MVTLWSEPHGPTPQATLSTLTCCPCASPAWEELLLAQSLPYFKVVHSSFWNCLTFFPYEILNQMCFIAKSANIVQVGLTYVRSHMEFIDEMNQMVHVVTSKYFFQFHPDPLSWDSCQAFCIFCNCFQSLRIVVTRCVNNFPVKPTEQTCPKVLASHQKAVLSIFLVLLVRSGRDLRNHLLISLLFFFSAQKTSSKKCLS